jgi:hypothetical protein
MLVLKAGLAMIFVWIGLASKTLHSTYNKPDKGELRLLVLDGHDSHLTARFNQIYKENSVIPIFCRRMSLIFYSLWMLAFLLL